MIVVPAPLNQGPATAEVKAALVSALAVVLGGMREAGMVGPAARLTLAPPPPFGPGAEGEIVGAWQVVIGLGEQVHRFGPKTTAATIEWCKRLGFPWEGFVTPAMWAVAFGVTFALPGGERVAVDASEPLVLSALGADVARVLGGQ